MLETKENKVHIEGILSEINLKEGSFKKNGEDMPSITGTISVRVNQTINGEDKELEIPVHMFASKYTNAGTDNPAYESVSTIMKEFVSIAASDIDHADRVRISGASIQMNEYYGQNGKLVSFPRVSASFVTKIKKEDCKPDASFSVVFMILNKGFETDKDGVENPNRYKMNVAIPQYGGKVDVVPFIAINNGVIDAVSNYWSEGDTVKANGKLNFTSTTEVEKVHVDFGEPTERVRTISVSDLVITGGSSTPMEGDFAINPDEVAVALTERKARLDELKNKTSNSGTHGKAPGTTSMSNRFKDLGF